MPFIPVTIHFRGRTLELVKVLLDTGSASALLKADIVGEIGIVPSSGTAMGSMTCETSNCFDGMSELEELSGDILAVPVPEEKREEVFEETRKAIELMKQGK
ncbi:hypothetical protein ACFFNY_20885 [Paenibacillus hodogayensis]|uniref:Peptidase A2 domain-containing protein n=1 Tax=Paenibacillus hodogayensis TaxID=279208 RepID=A0ABV5W0F2_9BACL